MYKGAELKFFAFYAGPVVLKDIIPDDQYYHFLLFYHASRYLWNKKTARRYVEVARIALRRFFNQLKQLYGVSSASMNMHNLNHVADNVVSTRCSMSEINAFPFENYLGKLKRALRSPTHILAQFCRREHEKSSILDQKAKLIGELEIKQDPNGTIKEIRYKQKNISTGSPNNMILLINNKVIEVQHIYHSVITDEILIDGVEWPVKQAIYDDGIINSGDQQSWELKNNSIPGNLTISLNQIENRMVRFDLNLDVDSDDRIFVISMLHE